MERVKVAVVGLGPAGLTAIKSLREEGFDVVGFERRDTIGGVWSTSSDLKYTSVIRETISNTSSFVSGFSDFPVPAGSLPYMTGEQVAEYFQAYAKHFHLEQHVRFRTTVRLVLRDDQDCGWNVHITGPDGDAILFFDKVVFGTGSDSLPSWPPMPGRELFQGSVIHSQSYRTPEQFAGKRVLVVGIGNTACEVALSLKGTASQVYQSYRRGRIIISRYTDDGAASDVIGGWPSLRWQEMLEHKLPWLALPLLDRRMRSQMISDAARQDPEDLGLSHEDKLKRAEEKIKGDWRLLPCASVAHVHPVVQDEYMPALYSGQIIPKHGFKAFTDEEDVLLADGSSIAVDAVIFCTGYILDFGIMPELEMDGTYGFPIVTTGKAGKRADVQGKPHIPRLFHMIFPPRWATSIAVLSWMSALETAWCMCELSSMAVAQAWAAETAKDKGFPSPPSGYRKPSLLPSEVEMNAEVDRYHTWWREQWDTEKSMHPGMVRSDSFGRFLHEMAGTGMYDEIDHALTLRGWRLWWNDPPLYKWISEGPANSYSWRIFETNPKGIPGCGRRTWPGARQAVEDAYNHYQKYKRELENKTERGDMQIEELIERK